MDVPEYLNYATQSKRILHKYLELPMPPNKIQCMYVWINGKRQGVNAKSRTLDFIPNVVQDVPIWSTTAYPTFHTNLTNSEIHLHPVALYKDPFRRGQNKIVLCETYYPDGQPTCSNKRKSCADILNSAKDDEPWFGFEQEYFLLNRKNLPIAGHELGLLGPLGLPLCGVGADRVFGRDIMEAHYRACLYAGISIAGTNVEGMPAQFEFQIGIGKDVSIGDDLWMARFILQRISEDFGVVASFDPKPFIGDCWIGSGCHTNFSTKSMREENGLSAIRKAIECLSKNHKRDVNLYDVDDGNIRRLTGNYVAPKLDEFSSGVASYNVSVRITKLVEDAGKGYLEDRRPCANCDPYTVAEVLVRSICLNR